MKRNLIGTLSLVVLSLLSTAIGAHAQAVANADVPFAFYVAQKHLPAGTYTVTAISDSTIAIRNRDTGEAVMSLARPESSRDATCKLVFHSIGDQYFLSQVWSGTGRAGLIVPTSKLEKEVMIAKTPASRGEVVIALK